MLLSWQIPAAAVCHSASASSVPAAPKPPGSPQEDRHSWQSPGDFSAWSPRVTLYHPELLAPPPGSFLGRVRYELKQNIFYKLI